MVRPIRLALGPLSTALSTTGAGSCKRVAASVCAAQAGSRQCSATRLCGAQPNGAEASTTLIPEMQR
eukprot:6209763-Pleurochrysis_carterae.AAC.3